MFGFLPARDPGAGATEALFGLIKARSFEFNGPTIEGRGTGFSGMNDAIPAGYTYFGQFVDHDITFDPTSILGRDNDPQALVNFRTPRFDLDSLYGSGPQDQPFLYDWDGSPRGVKLLVGRNTPDPSLPYEPACVDLPRNRQGRALVGDARNDENLIVAQLHLLFIHFHNKVVDRLCHGACDMQDAALFDEARRIVRWHYQWIVVHDFLERLVSPYVARCVLAPAAPGKGPVVTRRFYNWDDEPVIPVEFSAAAYRCGHSMVRDFYKPKAGGADFPILPTDKLPLHFGGSRVLPRLLEIEWEQFFDIRPHPHLPLPSLRMEARIAQALFSLPPDGEKALPRLNLQRGRALGLPAGRDVARAMGVEPLSFEELHLNNPLLPEPCATALFRATPLWYYILREAWVRGENAGHLGPVGGQIVAEVLVGLLEGDPQSYLRQWPAWTPAEEAKGLSLSGEHPGIFTMPDLVRFADPRLAAA